MVCNECGACADDGIRRWNDGTVGRDLGISWVSSVADVGRRRLETVVVFVGVVAGVLLVFLVFLWEAGAAVADDFDGEE